MLYLLLIIRGNVKLLNKIFIFLLIACKLSANQAARFSYTITNNKQVISEFSGRACASLPEQILFTPDDDVFATLMITNDKASLIDFRLQQVTKLAIAAKIKHEIVKIRALKDFCYSDAGQEHCFEFQHVKKSACQPVIDIPANFEIMEG